MLNKKKKTYLLKIMSRNGFDTKQHQLYNFERCKTCGKCCRHSSCSYTPFDILYSQGNITVKNIEKMLDEHKAMIQSALIKRSDGHIKIVLYLCAPEINAKQGINISIIHSPCALLTKRGCKLSPNNRPSQGLALIPHSDGKSCKTYMDSQKDILKKWEQYSKILRYIVWKRTGMTVEKIVYNELFSKKYYSTDTQNYITLPLHLVEKMTGQARPFINVWQYNALLDLLEIGFFEEYVKNGKEIREKIRLMLKNMFYSN